MSIFLQLLVNGLLLGGAYAIISISLTLIFGVVRVVNFAHGELLMVGLYATWLITSHTGMHPYATVIPIALLLFLVIPIMYLDRAQNAEPEDGDRK